MKNYTQFEDITKTNREVLEILINKYKTIKKLENEIKTIKEDNIINMKKIEKYIENKNIEGIQGDDFLVFLRDYTNSPSFKNVIELASNDKVINKTIASKLYGIYEDNKTTNKKLTVKL